MSRELDVFLHFLLLVVAVIAWFTSAHRRHSVSVQVLGLFLLITAIVDGIAATIMLNKYLANTIVSNLFLYHILTPIQYVIICFIYLPVVTNVRIKTVIRASALLFVLLSVVLTMYVQPLSAYPSYSILVKHTLTILLIMIYFYEVMSKTPYTTIYVQPIFWVSVGFLFHSCLNILLEGVSNYLHTYGSANYQLIYSLYSVSNYFLFLLFSTGLVISNAKLKTDEG